MASEGQRRQNGLPFEQKPGRRVPWVVLILATVLVLVVEYRRDLHGAREELAKVTTPPTSLLEAAFRSVAQGLLDIEEGRPADAVLSLTRARRAFERDAAASSVEGLLLWISPFLCLALAQAGHVEKARAMLPHVTRYLEATSLPEWLQRCRDALTMAGGGALH